MVTGYEFRVLGYEFRVLGYELTLSRRCERFSAKQSPANRMEIISAKACLELVEGAPRKDRNIGI